MGRARRDRRDAERKSRAKRRRKNDNTSDYYSSEVQKNHYTTKIETPLKTTDTEEKKHKQTSKSEEGHIQTEATPATKKPLDKIERMRQKKQLQKARRKEKKAAREAAAAAASK